MSRIRSVHPGIWTDDAFMALSAHARLLVIGLWTEAFDDGVFEWKLLTIKARLFPVDNIDIGALMGELIAGSFIRQEEVDGRKIGLIRNFREYQRPKKPNASGLLRPEWGSYVGISDDDTEPVPHHSPTSTGKPPQMEDGGGREGEEKHISLENEREFDDWYDAYPRHVGRGQARKAYRSARRKASAEELLAGASRATAEFAGKEPQYVPHPATWLNGERWLDQGAKPAASSGGIRDKNGYAPGDPLFGVL